MPDAPDVNVGGRIVERADEYTVAAARTPDGRSLGGDPAAVARWLAELEKEFQSATGEPWKEHIVVGNVAGVNSPADPWGDLADELLGKYSEDQPRGPDGRWGGGGSEAPTAEVATEPQATTGEAPPADPGGHMRTEVVPASGEAKVRLQTAEVTSIRQRDRDSANATEEIGFKGGGRAIFKPVHGEADLRMSIAQGTFYKREAAASSVAEVLGTHDLVPSTVERNLNGRVGSVQAFVEDAQQGTDFQTGVPGQYKEGAFGSSKEDMVRAAAFDFLTGNTDRHDGNWLVGNKDGKIALIDNGLSFGKDYKSSLRSELLNRATEQSLAIPAEVKAWAGKETELRAALEKHGIEKEAIKLAVDRLKILGESNTFIEARGKYHNQRTHGGNMLVGVVEEEKRGDVWDVAAWILGLKGEVGDDVIDAMADVLGGLFGDEALYLLDAAEEKGVKGDWNEDDHPRDDRGRFAAHGTEAADAAVAAIRAYRGGERPTPESAKELAKNLGRCSVGQLRAIMKEHDLKPPRPALKAKLVASLRKHFGKTDAKPPAQPRPAGRLGRRLEKPNVRIPKADVARVSRALGKNVDAGTIAAIGNAKDGASVTTEVEDGTIFIKTEGDGYEARRSILEAANGEKIVHNDFFEIKKDSPLKGQGAEMFANQVLALKDAGITRIEAHAAGSKDSKAYNGYYSWPRMGYDGEINAGSWAKLPGDLKEAMGESRSVLDLMSKPGGPEAWKEHGIGFDATFDLRDGSRSMKRLQAYLEERQARTKALAIGNMRSIIAGSPTTKEPTMPEKDAKKPDPRGDDPNLSDEDEAILEEVAQRIAAGDITID